MAGGAAGCAGATDTGWMTDGAGATGVAWATGVYGDDAGAGSGIILAIIPGSGSQQEAAGRVWWNKLANRSPQVAPCCPHLLQLVQAYDLEAWQLLQAYDLQ